LQPGQPAAPVCSVQPSFPDWAGCLASRETGFEPQWLKIGDNGTEAPHAGQKLKADWKKDLHNLGAGRKSRKPPTPFVGMKPYGKCQFIGLSYHKWASPDTAFFRNYF